MESTSCFNVLANSVIDIPNPSTMKQIFFPFLRDTSNPTYKAKLNNSKKIIVKLNWMQSCWEGVSKTAKPTQKGNSSQTLLSASAVLRYFHGFYALFFDLLIQGHLCWASDFSWPLEWLLEIGFSIHNGEQNLLEEYILKPPPFQIKSDATNSALEGTSLLSLWYLS